MKAKKISIILVLIATVLTCSIILASCDKTGDVNSIQSIEKTETEGLVDTYTITFTDGTSTTFTITNGRDGAAGVDGNAGAPGAKGDPGAPGVKGDPGADADASIRLVEETFFLGDLNLGVTLNDCVKADFEQEYEELEGSLDLNILFYNFFSDVKYSIYREGATIGETTYVDTIKALTALESSSNLIDVQAGYHGNYVLNVELYGENDTLLYTAERPINFKASHYNIYYLNATLPVLLATTQLYSETQKGVTYMGLDRRATYNWYELPSKTYAFPNTTVADGVTKLGLFDGDVEKTTVYGNQSVGSWGAIAQSTNPNHVLHTRKWIKDLYNMDKSSTFTFGSVDNSALSALVFSYGNSIPKSQFNIKMYTDGSATVGKLNRYNMDIYENWIAARADYLNFIDGIEGSPNFTSIFSKQTYSFAMCIDSNVEYIVNTKPGILASVVAEAAEGADVLKAIYEESITQLSVGDAFAKVELVGKTSELEYLLRTRWMDSTQAEGSAAEFFENDNGKKNLMILGTSEATESGYGVGATFMDLFQYVIDTYGTEYNVMYKGHPAWPLSRFANGAERLAFFQSNNILILPNATPAETYMYLYDNVYVGGYYSSTFASSMVDQTICFFGTEAAIKASSIAPMFDTTAPDYLGVFENSVFLNSTTIAPSP
ncbi:MAG: collagen-like triple helix repeat-containing protein [Fastidiosipilaceae bacterium]|jgi:hypothetical protein